MIKKLIGAAAALVIAITSIGTMKATATDTTMSTEDQIAALQLENATLKAQLAAYDGMLENFLVLIDQTTNGDLNGDGYTDAVDASIILRYYKYLSTGGTITLRNYMLEEGII